jgi:3-phenylpropionate/trans-cinnamate dioxygenase ferredoxin component
MNSEKSNGYTRICSINDLTEQEGRRFCAEDNEIAIFKIKGEVFALSNHCPHQHMAQIYDGFIEEGCVVCPSHGWMFDLRTGKTPAGSKGLVSYESMIIDNDVYIRLKGKEWKW